MIEVAHIVARVTTDLTRFNLGMSAAEARAKTMTQRMSLQGQRLTKYLSLPAAGIAYAAVKQFTDVNKQLTLIRTQAGGMNRSYKEWEDTVMRISRSSIFGPSQVAKGAYHVQSVFGDTRSMKQKADILRDSIKLATTGGEKDLEETTSAMSGLLRLHIRGVTDSTQAWKELNATVGSGNMRLGDVVSMLGTGVMPMMKNAGLSYRDVAASAAVLTDENMKGNKFLTLMGTGITNLERDSSKKAHAAWEEMGLSVKKIGGMIQSGQYVQAIGMISDAYDKLKKRIGKQQAYADFATATGGARGAKVLMSIVNQAAVLRQKWTQQSKIAAQSDKGYAETMKTTSAQLKVAWSSIQIGLYNLGKVIAPVAVKIAKIFAQIASAFSHAPKNVQHLIGMFILAAIVLGPFLVIMSGIITLVSGMGIVFLGLGASIGLLVYGVIASMVYLNMFAAKSERWKQMLVGAELAVAHAFMGLVGVIRNVVQWVISHFTRLVNWLRALPGRVYAAAHRIGTAIKNGIEDGIGGTIDKVIRKLSILAHPTRWGGALLGAMKGAILHRALGGPVSSGMPYVVGERGPELFVPRSGGTIMPNRAFGGRQLAMAGGYGGPMVEIGAVHVRHEEDAEVLAAKIASRMVLR